jgi:hypothetical protein
MSKNSNLYFSNVVISNNPLNTAKTNILNNFDKEYELNSLSDVYDPEGTRFAYEFKENKILITYSPTHKFCINTIQNIQTKYLNSKIIYISNNVPNFFDDYYSDNLICFGVSNNEISKENLIVFTLDKIKQKKLDKIADHIVKLYTKHYVHIIFDLSVMENKYAPSLLNNKKNDNGINLQDIELLFSKLKVLNIVALDVINYNLNIDTTDIKFRIMCETARIPLIKIFDFKERSINIFNENTKFLIWRPLEQEDSDDIGWYILRNISIDDREKYINEIDNNTDINKRVKVLTFIDKENDGTIDKTIDICITTTTIAEQQNKNYYCANFTNDYTLFADEKINMAFELLNTFENE